MPHFRPISVCILSLLAISAQTSSLMGQTSETETDDATIRFGAIDQTVAGEWAKLVLGAIDTEFPNKLSLVYVDTDQIKTPKEHFPAFYGCFDWHSSVHGHWLLARLLRTHPSMEAAPRIRTALATHLTRENIERETEFFRRDEHKSFERMYGWAWYLRLVIELDGWNDADAQIWRENLRPLEALFVERITAYLPLLTFPIRTGQHTDTGFALGQILDYARAMQIAPLEQMVIDRAGAFYRSDVDYPVRYEPSGHDFFSSGWNEADLMRRVMPTAEFVRWLEKFVPDVAVQLSDGTIAPVRVSDVTDGKLVHLAGLNLNRAWCLRAVANALPEEHPLRRPLLESAAKHLAAGLAYVNSGHYEGDHWLATFGLYAITQASETGHE